MPAGRNKADINNLKQVEFATLAKVYHSINVKVKRFLKKGEKGMEILLSWLHFLQVFLIGLGIVIATPLAFFVAKAVISAGIAFVKFIVWGLKK